MKILVVTNLYPTKKRPFICPFVKEQVEALKEIYPDMTIDVYVIEGWRPRWEYIRAMLRLPSIAKKGNYDLVHAHFGLTLVSTLFIGAPVVITFHGTDLLANPTKHVSRLLAPMASKVIVVARRLRDALGYGEVIPCGIEAKRFALPSSIGSKPVPRIPGSLKILFPSDPERRVKNYGLFQSVCKELEKRGNKVTEVHLVNIEREMVREIYWGCDLMLLMSLSEGSPTVVKEAIAAKLPFVSVDVGDVGEWADLISFGVVVSDRNPNTIADAVTTLLARIESRGAMDNRKCVDAMDGESIAKKVRGVYDTVIRERTKELLLQRHQ